MSESAEGPARQKFCPFQLCAGERLRPFNRFLAVVRRCGPVTVIPQKTRIVFMARVRFGGGYTRKHWFQAGLWLKRRVSHRCLVRIESFTPGNFGHHFRFKKPSDVDRRIAALAREAYAIGCQQHFKRKT